MSKESFRIVVLLVKSIPNVILRYMYIQYCKKKMNIWIKYLHRPYQAGVAKGKKYSCIVSERLRRDVLDTFLILQIGIILCIIHKSKYSM